MKIAKLLAYIAIIPTYANASDTGSTVDIYKSLNNAQKFAVCAVAANLNLPRDELLLDKYLLKFRKEKNIPILIPNSFLLGLGKNWIEANGYEDRMAEVYTLC